MKQLGPSFRCCKGYYIFIFKLLRGEANICNIYNKGENQMSSIESLRKSSIKAFDFKKQLLHPYNIHISPKILKPL